MQKGLMSRIAVLMMPLIAVIFLQGCIPPQGGGQISYTNEPFGDFKPLEEKDYKIKRDVSSFEEEGRRWGTKHWKDKQRSANTIASSTASPMKSNISNDAVNEKMPKPKLRQCYQKYENIDRDFVEVLIDRAAINYFWVNTELKEAFKKGYRLGYLDRTADLILGPHLMVAASCIGEHTGSSLVQVISSFENNWANTLKGAVDVFIVLISEGSQADREEFIKAFSAEYTAKYNRTFDELKKGGYVTQRSEGGTMLYLDASKTMAYLDIPRPESLKTEIYQQTFRVMGDEWGRKYSQNMIKRGDLTELIRRSKTAFQEVQPGLQGNLTIVQDNFRKSYGTDADNVFRGLLKDAALL